MAIDTYHRYSNEAERANIYDGFKLKNPLVSIIYTKTFQRFNPLSAEFFHENLGEQGFYFNLKSS